MCEDEKDLMGRYCAKTCNLCSEEIELAVEPVPKGRNEVVEVFRKGADSLFAQSDSERIESEKELIKLLLADKKQKRELEQNKKETNEIPKVDSKKKELVADEILKIVTKSNDVNSVETPQQEKKGLSEESFGALVKVLNADDTAKTAAKKEVKTEDSNKALRALMGLLSTESEDKKKEASSSTQEKRKVSQKSFDALMKLLSKEDLTKKAITTQGMPVVASVYLTLKL